VTIIPALDRLSSGRFETPAILKALALASRKLAELKGVAASIPNQGILINTLGLQEAKNSSAIENIVTTHDELFKDDALPSRTGQATSCIRHPRNRRLQSLRAQISRVHIATNQVTGSSNKVHYTTGIFKVSRVISSIKANYYRQIVAVCSWPSLRVPGSTLSCQTVDWC